MKKCQFCRKRIRFYQKKYKRKMMIKGTPIYKIVHFHTDCLGKYNLGIITQGKVYEFYNGEIPEGKDFV